MHLSFSFVFTEAEEVGKKCIRRFYGPELCLQSLLQLPQLDHVALGEQLVALDR